ncbi:E3 ubiquitin-protein ligase RNF146-B-like [Hetaerina americana]|uniref:E3 ubiquitin-protein ligase RNF146-B-like n=1 Tax=Hetaerina americana TaxID=62018 RepID=UPI003A7F51F7
MAESLDDNRSKNGDEMDGRDAVVASSKDAVEDGSIPECAVCLQTCVHPSRLPCGHIFCFLCIKGTVATAQPGSVRRCAICRREIPLDFLDKPVLLCPIFRNAPPPPVQPRTDASATPNEQEGYLWFYEGRNGWWQYDERTSLELEGAYKRGERSCELLIAGFLYVADFDGMVQLRRRDPSRRRRIKRDLASIPVKGVAGLRTRSHGNAQPQQTVMAVVEEDQCFPPMGHHQTSHHYGPATTPPTPVNTPGTATPPQGAAPGGSSYLTAVASSSSLRRVVEEMGRLQLSGVGSGEGASSCATSGRGGEGTGGESEGGGVGDDGPGAGGEESGGGVRRAAESVLWSPVSPDIASASPWVLTLSSDEDQL